MKMGLSINIGLNRGRAGFSEARLFTGSGAGLWYDPSTIATLFQDNAGVSAVTAAAQSVGLVLDRSRGLSQGAELVANPGNPFTSTTGYSAGGSATISVDTGRLKVDQTVGFTDGVLCALPNNSFANSAVISFNVDLGTSTLVQVQAGNGNFGNGGVITVNITASGIYNIITTTRTTGASGLTFKAGSASSFFLSRVSVRELPGNHAPQSNSGFRSLYQTGPTRQVYDGSDDRDPSPLVPTTAGTLVARFNGTTASRVIIGSQGATDGRCFLALAADGSVAAGIGTQTTATIKGSADARNAWTTGVVTWDGTTVRLYQNGVQVYSGAQSGAVNTTVAIMRGCLNNNGTAADFWAGSISPTIALNRAMTAAEVASLHARWAYIA